MCNRADNSGRSVAENCRHPAAGQLRDGLDGPRAPELRRELHPLTHVSRVAAIASPTATARTLPRDQTACATADALRNGDRGSSRGPPAERGLHVRVRPEYERLDALWGQQRCRRIVA